MVANLSVGLLLVVRNQKSVIPMVANAYKHDSTAVITIFSAREIICNTKIGMLMIRRIGRP